jgi:hypothetical protein
LAALILPAVLRRFRVFQRSTSASIAGLPLINLTGNSSDEYAGDGISEELTEALGGNPRGRQRKRFRLRCRSVRIGCPAEGRNRRCQVIEGDSCRDI